jgi:DNA-binding NarL/FixJ family response regulator
MGYYMNEVIDFILTKMPLGIMVFDKGLDVIYCNRHATGFLKRFDLPQEITIISKRIFDAITTSRLKELFPGEIYISKKIDGSPSNWTFRLFTHENSKPFVSLYIIEETISNRLALNEIRQRYKLTRRETDVLRRVLDGLKNVEIAEDMEIAEQTVKDHLSNIYIKLGVENRFMGIILNIGA